MAFEGGFECHGVVGCHRGVKIWHADVVCNNSYGGGHRGRATATTRTIVDMAMAGLGRLGKDGSFVAVDDVDGFAGGFDRQEVC